MEDADVSAAKAAAKEALQGVVQGVKAEAPPAKPTAAAAPPARRRCMYVVRVVRAEPTEPREVQSDEKRALTAERVAALSQTIAEKQAGRHCRGFKWPHPSPWPLQGFRGGNNAEDSPLASSRSSAASLVKMSPVPARGFASAEPKSARGRRSSGLCKPSSGRSLTRCAVAHDHGC